MMNPWVLGQLAEQHLTELRADAAKANRGSSNRNSRLRKREWTARLRWPVRQAVGCEV
jgi:hypothetical protein